MSDAKGQVEPPMEEILASIRRIISEDEKEETDLETDDLQAAQQADLSDDQDDFEEAPLDLDSESLDHQSLELTDELDMPASELELVDVVEAEAVAEDTNNGSDIVLTLDDDVSDEALTLDDALTLEDALPPEDKADDVLDLTDAQPYYPKELAASPVEEALAQMDEEGDEALELTERIEDDGHVAGIEDDLDETSSVMREFEENDQGISEIDLLMANRAEAPQKPEASSEPAPAETSLSDVIEQNLVDQIDVSEVMEEITASVAPEAMSTESAIEASAPIETSSVFDTENDQSDSIVDAFVTQTEDQLQAETAQGDAEMEQLMSESSASSSAAAFAALAKAAQEKEVSSAPKQEMPDIAVPNQSLEGLVSEMLRPMLKEWLDKNLPAMVDNIVKKEIKRLTAGH